MLPNLSNALTISRIIVIPVIVILIYMKGPIYAWTAFILFCIAGITDYYDGYFARIRKEISNLGIFMDPIADKLLVASVILILTSKEIISNFEIIPALIILGREITVSGLREFLAQIKVSVPVSKIAKFKTALQLIALGILILSEGEIAVITVLFLGKIALWIAALLTLYTGYDYLKSGLKHF